MLPRHIGRSRSHQAKAHAKRPPATLAGPERFVHCPCKTPDMAEKELLAYLVAHNLIRCVMAEAVARYAVDLERISFKGSVDALRQYSEAIGKARHRKAQTGDSGTAPDTGRHR